MFVIEARGGDYSEAPVSAFDYQERAASQTVDFDAVSRGLGETWEILNSCHKPYPCGVVLFPVLDGCSKQMTRQIRCGYRVDI